MPRRPRRCGYVEASSIVLGSRASLHAFKLIPAKAAHRPATVRQLLTHTAGLPQLVYPSRALKPVLGETVKFGQRVPTLAEYYRGGLHLVAEPGTRHTYSNHDFATLGQIVEDVSGESLARYVRDHIFGPLAMEETDLVRSDRVKSRLATGYRLRSGGPHPVSDCELVTPGAGSIYSTTGDMGRYVAALLGGGTGDHGSILKSETLASMFAPQYQPDPRLPGMGLAFFRGELGRSSGRRARRAGARLQFPDVRGSRRQRWCAGLHQWGEERADMAGS